MEINQSICFCNNCNEFLDIFDVNHYKSTLQADVRVVSSLPSVHLMSRLTIENKIPYEVLVGRMLIPYEVLVGRMLIPYEVFYD